MSASGERISTLLDEHHEDGTIARPPRRWLSRVLIPLAILGSAGGLLTFSARSSFIAATDVWVAPVVSVARGAEPEQSGANGEKPMSSGAMIVQAPGWIEPDPFPLNVPAMTEGVVKEVLVLEGDRVESGQVVARLVDEDARLVLQAAQARLAAQQASALKAESDVLLALEHEEEAQYLANRAREIAESGAGAEGERVLAEIRLRSTQQMVAAARAAAEMARAEIRRQEVACAEAGVALKRTQIVSTGSGVVMSRRIEPGMRLSLGGSKPEMAEQHLNGVVLRLFDPQKLQVRVEVPLADFAKLQVGMRAEMVTESLPDYVFHGRVTRVVPEASIQRNTVQVKVSIENPDALLKPEMLVRVRFHGFLDTPSGADSGKGSEAGNFHSRLRMLIPESALIRRTGDQAFVWLVNHDAQGDGMVAQEGSVTFTQSREAGFVEVQSGLQAGDRVVVDPPVSLATGNRVRVLGEKKSPGSDRPRGENP